MFSLLGGSLCAASKRVACLLLILLPGGIEAAAPPRPVAVWTKHEKSAIVGRRWDVPLGYAPDLKRFVVLGGRVNFADARKARSYDVLSLNPGGEWDNELPAGVGWGKKTGPFVVPALMAPALS